MQRKNKGTDEGVFGKPFGGDVVVHESHYSTATSSEVKDFVSRSICISGTPLKGAITVPINIEKDSRRRANLIANRGHIILTSE